MAGFIHLANQSLKTVIMPTNPSPTPDLLANAVTARAFIALSGSLPEGHEHHHREGQLVLSVAGVVACKVVDTHWIVPPYCALWIPAGIPHESQASANARGYFLFIDTQVSPLPDECCTLRITPMLREMIIELADSRDRHSARGRELMSQLLLEELGSMPLERTCFPIPADPRLRRIAEALIEAPDDRKTLEHWSRLVGMSERTLSRRLFAETGMSFGAWRRQLHLMVALRGLAAGDTVQQVAGDLGYEAVTGFITMFKRALGTTPAKYFAGRRERLNRASDS
ncbi:Helix-turn-helix domain protein [compost metagenome]